MKKILNYKYITGIGYQTLTYIKDLEEYEAPPQKRNEYLVIDNKLYFKPYIVITMINNDTHIVYYDTERLAELSFKLVRSRFIYNSFIEIDEDGSII